MPCCPRRRKDWPSMQGQPAELSTVQSCKTYAVAACGAPARAAANGGPPPPEAAALAARGPQGFQPAAECAKNGVRKRRVFDPRTLPAEGKRAVASASARNDRAKSAVFRDRSASRRERSPRRLKCAPLCVLSREKVQRKPIRRHGCSGLLRKAREKPPLAAGVFRTLQKSTYKFFG